jgi:Protein of unknown function (DUF2934)
MPKSMRRRTDDVAARSSAESPLIASGSSDVSERDVARRAFERYCARGCEDGHDMDDWLHAERELREGVGATAGQRP